MTQLAQRLRLDLTDTLTCDIELFSDFLKCSCTSVLQSKTQCQHLLLTLRQRSEHFLQLFF